MDDFPAFMKCSANRIASSSQSTPGVEGYVFDGVDGSQMAFWTCRETAASAMHAHEYDEYMMVVQDCYTLIIYGQQIPSGSGEEYFIPRAPCMVAEFKQEQERFTHLADTGQTGFGNNLADRNPALLDDQEGAHG